MNWILAISVAGFVLSVFALLLSYNVTVATQRAFVSIKEFYAFMIAGKLVIMPLWQNTGGTPTRNMMNHVNWRFFRDGVPEDFDFADLRADGSSDDRSNNQKMFIAPKGEVFSEKLNIPTEHVERARIGEGILLVWGWTTYDDVFWFTSSHKTKFCNVIEITTISIGEDNKVTAGLSFRQHSKHNCIDNECQ